MLEQEEHPVIFISRKLNKAESNYSQTEREALGIVWAVKRLYKFLIGNTFEIVTDHKALQYVFSPGKEISSIQAARLQRWAILLSSYDYTIVYKPSSNVDTKVYFNTGECSITS